MLHGLIYGSWSCDLLRFRPFVKVLEEDVRAQARESDQRFRSKTPRSVFEGVPVSWRPSRSSDERL